MKTRYAELTLLAVALIASAGWIFTKAALQEFQPYTFMGIRFLLATSVLALFCGPELRRLNRSQVLRSLAIGVALGSGLLCWSIALSLTDSVGEGAFIVSLSIVLVPLVGRMLFGDPLKPLLFAALVPAIGGLYLLMADNLSGSFEFETAQLLFMLSTLGFATHLSLSGHYVKDVPSLPLSTLQLGMTGVIASIGALVVDLPLSEQGLLVDGQMQISNSAWALLLASALIATSFRFGLQTKALQHVNPTHASMIFLAEPVCTASLGAWWFQETMSGNQLLGCMLIFAALMFYRGAPLLRNITRTKANK